LLAGQEGTLSVPQLVVTELCYLVQTRLGTGGAAVLGDVASGAFSVEPVAATNWFRVIELVDTYRDVPLGTVDSSVVACAERLRYGLVLGLVGDLDIHLVKALTGAARRSVLRHGHCGRQRERRWS
jgi:hypothetical protein